MNRQQLPAPLRDCFDAVDQHDVGATLFPFAEDAVVKDEGHTHEGRAAIASWAEETTEKYRVTIQVSEVSMDDSTVRVVALVSGTFPGSPITLHYAFTLKAGKIARLEIGA
jgi:hypothetical protein